MSEKTLLIVSVGPVQSYIAQARKLEDLWGGSYMLSYLTEIAVTELFVLAQEKQIKVEMVYPNQKPDYLTSVDCDDPRVEIAALPNRFVSLMHCSSTEAAFIAGVLEKKVMEEFKQSCDSALEFVFPSHTRNEFLNEMSEAQAASFLDVFWATEGLYEKDYADKRKQLEKHLAAIKNNRNFSAFPFPEGVVCSLCGERTALTDTPFSSNQKMGAMKHQLSLFWKKRKTPFAQVDTGNQESPGRIRENEFLCTVCLGKRTARDYFKEERKAPNLFNKFESVVELTEKDTEYYAILLMDGDDMGKWYDRRNEGTLKMGCQSSTDLEHHQWLSKKLMYFATRTVPELVQMENGRLIYAGGDDVLTLVPVKNMLALAGALRDKFADSDTGLHETATASAGLVVVHKKAPLQAAFQSARKLEALAKNYRNPQNGKKKDALALALYTRGGEKREVVLPWLLQKRNSVEILIDIINALKYHLSPNFLYAFGQAFLPLVAGDMQKKLNIFDDNPLLRQEFFKVELARLLKRSVEGKESKEFIDAIPALASDMALLHEMVPSTLQFVHLLEIARTLAGIGKRKNTVTGGIM